LIHNPARDRALAIERVRDVNRAPQGKRLGVLLFSSGLGCSLFSKSCSLMEAIRGRNSSRPKQK
jgi:hypothetical protein